MKYNHKKGVGIIPEVEPNEIDASSAINLIKILFSPVGSTYISDSPKSITSKNIDDTNKLIEKSTNLQKEIPQLLVDIQATDATNFMAWYDTDKKYPHLKHPEPIRILNRFTDAFNTLFDGSKKFKEIRNEKDIKNVIFENRDGTEVGLSGLSTGECQIVFRVGFILKNLGIFHSGIILIDEPELSLHPQWQRKYRDFLSAIFKDKDVQIIFATHSPYIFEGMQIDEDICIKIDREEKESTCINLIPFSKSGLTLSPNYVSYLAYGIATEGFHIELFTLLFEAVKKRTGKSNLNIDQLNNYLESEHEDDFPVKKIFTRTGQTKLEKETLPVWIRNCIHHPEEKKRDKFSLADLKESISKMLNLLEKLNK